MGAEAEGANAGRAITSTAVDRNGSQVRSPRNTSLRKKLRSAGLFTTSMGAVTYTLD